MKALRSENGQLVSFRFIMGQHGWARLVFALDDTETCIHLSEVFDPFEDLAAWIDDIARARLPAEVGINEEGCITVLLAEPFSPQLVALTVRDADGEIYLHTQLDRQRLVRKLRQELLRFFRQEFDDNHWDSHRRMTDGFIGAKETVLRYPWFDG